MIKIRIQFSCVKLKCLIRIDFLWRKDHIYTRHCSKQTSKLWQLQNKKIWIRLQLLSLLFTHWTEVNLRTLINRRWEWIILSVRSLTVFLRKRCRDSPCQTFFWREFRYVYEENRTVIHRPRRANNIYMCTWNRTESYWPCEVHVYWSACFFNWKTKIQRITIPLPWYLWFIGFRLTTTLKKNKEQKLTIPLRAYQSDIE